MKQLHIRNTAEGMIWQVYNIENQFELEVISENATRNGFQSIETITNPNIIDEYEETFPNWRKSKGWIEILNDNKDDPRMEQVF